MPTQIALLRGINVGKAKRVAMADLVKLFKTEGFPHVETLLNSGNVVFTGPTASEPKLEAAFTERFGFSSRITVITAKELNEAVAENPSLSIEDPPRYFVAFLKSPQHRTLIAPLAEETWHPESFSLGQRTAYLWCPGGALDSPLSTRLNKALKDAVTVRNWATVLKLQALTQKQAL